MFPNGVAEDPAEHFDVIAEALVQAVTGHLSRRQRLLSPCLCNSRSTQQGRTGVEWGGVEQSGAERKQENHASKEEGGRGGGSGEVTKQHQQ